MNILSRALVGGRAVTAAALSSNGLWDEDDSGTDSVEFDPSKTDDTPESADTGGCDDITVNAANTNPNADTDDKEWDGTVINGKMTSHEKALSAMKGTRAIVAPDESEVHAIRQQKVRAEFTIRHSNDPLENFKGAAETKQLVLAMMKQDKNLFVRSVLNNAMIISKPQEFPSGKNHFNEFFANVPHVNTIGNGTAHVIFTISTRTPEDETDPHPDLLSKLMRPGPFFEYLRKHAIWLKPHDYDGDDITSAGNITRLPFAVMDKQDLAARLHAQLTIYQDNENFASCIEPPVKVPPFHIQGRRMTHIPRDENDKPVKHLLAETLAFEVMCEAEHVNLLGEIFMAAELSSSRFGTFIPRGMNRSDTFRQVIQENNRYQGDVYTIPIYGLHPAVMNSPISMFSNLDPEPRECDTLRDYIEQFDGILSTTPGIRVASDGVWKIVTTFPLKQAAFKFLTDTIIPAIQTCAEYKQHKDDNIFYISGISLMSRDQAKKQSFEAKIRCGIDNRSVATPTNSTQIDSSHYDTVSYASRVSKKRGFHFDYDATPALHSNSAPPSNVGGPSRSMLRRASGDDSISRDSVSVATPVSLPSVQTSATQISQLTDSIQSMTESLQSLQNKFDHQSKQLDLQAQKLSQQEIWQKDIEERLTTQRALDAKHNEEIRNRETKRFDGIMAADRGRAEEMARSDAAKRESSDANQLAILALIQQMQGQYSAQGLSFVPSPPLTPHTNNPHRPAPTNLPTYTESTAPIPPVQPVQMTTYTTSPPMHGYHDATGEQSHPPAAATTITANATQSSTNLNESTMSNPFPDFDDDEPIPILADQSMMQDVGNASRESDYYPDQSRGEGDDTSFDEDSSSPTEGELHDTMQSLDISQDTIPPKMNSAMADEEATHQQTRH